MKTLCGGRSGDLETCVRHYEVRAAEGVHSQLTQITTRKAFTLFTLHECYTYKTGHPALRVFERLSDLLASLYAADTPASRKTSDGWHHMAE